MRYAMYMATEFMYQQLHGNNAAAIDDPNTGLRFMNDLATYEIFWHFLYLTVFHGAELTADGKYSKKGERVTPELFMKLLDERRETVKELFKKLGTDYEDTDAELVLQILKRQVVDDGRTARSCRSRAGSSTARACCCRSSSRVDADRDGDPRRDLQPVARRAAGARRARAATRRAATAPSSALRAHDYVYDVFESAEGVAA